MVGGAEPLNAFTTGLAGWIESGPLEPAAASTGPNTEPASCVEAPPPRLASGVPAAPPGGGPLTRATHAGTRRTRPMTIAALVRAVGRTVRVDRGCRGSIRFDQ